MWENLHSLTLHTVTYLNVSINPQLILNTEPRPAAETSVLKLTQDSTYWTMGITVVHPHLIFV